MKCARCGTGLSNDTMVCSQCGAVVGLSYGPNESKPQAFAPRPMVPQAMSTGTGRAVPLLPRVKGLLRSPKREWPVIASEATSASAIFTGYVMPLAAIGAIALFVSEFAIGTSMPILGVVRTDLARGVAGAALVFAFALAHLYLLSRIVAALTRRFGDGQAGNGQALKLTAYSYTPIWLAGILFLVPGFSVLWLAAMLYALYLAFVGLPIVTRCPQERALKVVIVAAVAAYLLSLVFAGLLVALVGFGPALLG